MTVGVALGGLAQGLAEGMNMGMQWRNQQQYLDLQKQHQDRMTKADERDSEIHEMKKDQYASEKAIRDRRNNALQEIAQYTTQAFQQPQQAEAPQAPGIAPQGTLAPNMQPKPDQPGSLAATPQIQPPAPEQRLEKPGMVLAKGMVTGAYSPEMLTNIANIFAKHGLHDEGVKYMEQAYTAQKRGLTQAAMALLQNNPGAAISTLQQGGMNVKDMPVKVKPSDPNDHNWKVNIDGQGEKTVNVSDLLQSTMDPEKFFEVEDKKRKAGLEEQKQSNDNRLTNAQIKYYNSRSSLADANADKADRAGMGGLKPTRSSEAQINTAISRRDKSFDRVASVKDEETGKFEVDPMKRQTLDSASNQYQDFLEEKLGEELDARQHHKFTDAMVTFPVGGTEAQIRKWERTELFPRFGGRTAQSIDSRESGNSGNLRAQGSASAAPVTPPGQPKPGTLAGLSDKRVALEHLNSEMKAVQLALKSPNLNVEQKKVLSLKAQDIATRRDALK